MVFWYLIACQYSYSNGLHGVLFRILNISFFLLRRQFSNPHVLKIVHHRAYMWTDNSNANVLLTDIRLTMLGRYLKFSDRTYFVDISTISWS